MAYLFQIRLTLYHLLLMMAATGETHAPRSIPALVDVMRIQGKVAAREAVVGCSYGGGRGAVIGKVPP